ncbi:MAG: orotate phosphoribosyltransferase [Anaerolineales bacterium]|nr:orotate phosphoribosyltransferase [Anaerolineales bacterium]
MKESIAGALLDIEAVRFNPYHPTTFKSGIRSPIYVDNRRLPFHPEAWRVILDGFQEMVADQGILFDVIAGVEAAGIPHSAALGYAMNKPSIFVRKQPKDHGTQQRVEGGDVLGRRVVLVEDLVTTGSSSLDAIDALQQAGAVVTDCLCIVTYGFQQTWTRFAAADILLRPLVTFDVILGEATQRAMFDTKAEQMIRDWLGDPEGWGQKYG